jgi:hypothetical protein
MLDKTSRSPAQVGMLGSNNGQKRMQDLGARVEALMEEKLKLKESFKSGLRWTKMPFRSGRRGI